jgi:hypothetical protein
MSSSVYYNYKIRGNGKSMQFELNTLFFFALIQDPPSLSQMQNLKQFSHLLPGSNAVALQKNRDI